MPNSESIADEDDRVAKHQQSKAAKYSLLYGQLARSFAWSPGGIHH
jgi:hypothetical protein